MTNLTVITSIILFQLMFVYSGITKIAKFDSKVETLIKKIKARLNLDIASFVAKFGMIGVIVLEIVGSLCLVAFAIYKSNKKPSKSIEQAVFCLLVAFVSFIVVVTHLYHPWSEQKIPFLSNLTTLSGFLLMQQALGVSM